MTPSLDLSELQVLIIDDIKSVRSILKKALKSLGIQFVNEACNVQDAMLTIKNKPVDLIFSDWNMENGDGIDLL